MLLSDKRICDNQFGILYDTTMSKFKIFDLSNTEQAIKVKLEEG